MRQFTTRQAPSEIRTKPQEGKHDSEVSPKQDDFYATTWEYDYEQPIFDATNNNATPRNSLEIPIQSDKSTEEMRKIPGNAHECSPEVFPETEELRDVTHTYTDMETSSEQPNSSPTNPRCSKYNLCHNPKPNCNDNYRF